MQKLDGDLLARERVPCLVHTPHGARRDLARQDEATIEHLRLTLRSERASWRHRYSRSGLWRSRGAARLGQGGLFERAYQRRCVVMTLFHLPAAPLDSEKPRYIGKAIPTP